VDPTRRREPYQPPTEEGLRAHKHRHQQPETSTPSSLMTPVKQKWAPHLVELGGVLPSGDVRRPEVFRSAPLEEVSGARALEAAEKAAFD
jgi:hypothetical protein